jgi:hypothetical protein
MELGRAQASVVIVVAHGYAASFVVVVAMVPFRALRNSSAVPA